MNAQGQLVPWIKFNCFQHHNWVFFTTFKDSLPIMKKTKNIYNFSLFQSKTINKCTRDLHILTREDKYIHIVIYNIYSILLYILHLDMIKSMFEFSSINVVRSTRTQVTGYELILVSGYDDLTWRVRVDLGRSRTGTSWLETET